MPGTRRHSNCSLGVEVDFYWYECADPDGHLAAAVGAVWEAPQSSTRRWNPWTSRMVRAEIKGRLERAAAGALKPVDEVKAIGERDVLFEIRWLDIAVTDIGTDGELHHTLTDARLLHVEPIELSVCAVGLHAHEKPHIDDRAATRLAQDTEILTALQRDDAGIGDHWGLLKA